MLKKIRSYLVLLVTLFGLVGCTNREINYENLAQHKDLVEETDYGNISMSFSLLNGDDIRTFHTRPGKKYNFEYTYLITEGSILLQFRDSEDNVLDEVLLSDEEYKLEKTKLESENDGSVNIYEFGSLTRIYSRDVEIKIVISGINAKGKLSVKW